MHGCKMPVQESTRLITERHNLRNRTVAHAVIIISGKGACDPGLYLPEIAFVPGDVTCRKIRRVHRYKACQIPASNAGGSTVADSLNGLLGLRGRVGAGLRRAGERGEAKKQAHGRAQHTPPCSGTPNENKHSRTLHSRFSSTFLTAAGRVLRAFSPRFSGINAALPSRFQRKPTTDGIVPSLQCAPNTQEQPKQCRRAQKESRAETTA